MLKVSEYFEGKVKSIALQTATLPATVGVMSPGKYQFSTAEKETMHIISGAMNVKLPDTDEWQSFREGQSFEVPEKSKFDLEIASDTAYYCQYWK